MLTVYQNVLHDENNVIAQATLLVEIFTAEDICTHGSQLRVALYTASKLLQWLWWYPAYLPSLHRSITVRIA